MRKCPLAASERGWLRLEPRPQGAEQFHSGERLAQVPLLESVLQEVWSTRRMSLCPRQMLVSLFYSVFFLHDTKMPLGSASLRF